MTPVKIRSVADYAKDLPMFDTEAARLIALHKATRRLSRVLSPLTSHPQGEGKINPWMRDSITDALNEIVAHLEIMGALQESVSFACTAHKKKQLLLLDFLREIAFRCGPEEKTITAKLKEWNL